MLLVAQQRLSGHSRTVRPRGSFVISGALHLLTVGSAADDSVGNAGD
jgi:hypothetical protein